MSVKKGNKVRVEYTGTLEDGTVFDSTQHGDHSHPFEFVVGRGDVIKGFDEAVIGMEVGDEKEITLKPEEAYGEIREDLTKEVPRDNLPKDKEPEPGMTLIMALPDGMQIPAKIKAVEGDRVILDLNHPLAGKTLKFKIKLVEIVE